MTPAGPDPVPCVLRPVGQPEWCALLQAARRSPLPWRNRTILLLIWQGPVRPDVLLRLQVWDVQLAGRLLRPAQARPVRLSEEAAVALVAYLALERSTRCAALFSGRGGRPLSPPELAQVFRRLSAVAGLQVSPWSLHLGALCARRAADHP